jgi:phage N-6-adenine-methyltransferase
VAKRNTSKDKKSSLWSAGGAGFSSASDDWATPAPVFAALDAEFHFTLDVCASAANAKCRRYFTVADNGLTQKWSGRVWMNPPYGRALAAWMKKAVAAADAGATVVCLVPSRTDNAWWHDQVMARASEVRLVRGRLKFGDGRNSAPFPSAVVIFRPRRGRLRFSAWVPPRPARDDTISMKSSRRPNVVACPANVDFKRRRP